MWTWHPQHCCVPCIPLLPPPPWQPCIPSPPATVSVSLIGLHGVFKCSVSSPGLEHHEAGQRQGVVCLQHGGARDGEANDQSRTAAGLPQARKQVGSSSFLNMKKVEVFLERAWGKDYWIYWGLAHIFRMLFSFHVTELKRKLREQWYPLPLGHGVVCLGEKGGTLS